MFTIIQDAKCKKTIVSCVPVKTACKTIVICVSVKTACNWESHVTKRIFTFVVILIFTNRVLELF